MISLGSLPEVFSFVAQTLSKRENSNSQSFLYEIAFEQQNQGVRATIMRET